MLTIDTDPGGERVYDAHLPWQRSIAVGPDVQLLQVVAVGKDTTAAGLPNIGGWQSCRRASAWRRRSLHLQSLVVTSIGR
jgi:hypothetical protein